jgi:hypothetical protein
MNNREYWKFEELTEFVANVFGRKGGMSGREISFREDKASVPAMFRLE